VIEAGVGWSTPDTRIVVLIPCIACSGRLTLDHRSAVQHRGYSLGESTQVFEKRIDLSTLQND
jgi:hypothetical protein